MRRGGGSRERESIVLPVKRGVEGVVMVGGEEEERGQGL